MARATGEKADQTVAAFAAAALCFMTLFFAVGDAAAQHAVCRNTGAFCGRSLEAQCLTKFGAAAIGEDDVRVTEACRTQFEEYRDCLVLVSAQCPASAPREGEPEVSGAPKTASSALEIWNEIKAAEDADVFEAFARSYPASPLAVLAGKRAAALREAARNGAAPPAPAASPSKEEVEAQQDERKLRAALLEGQRYLNRLGYEAGPEDGEWGARSAKALERFLTETGQEASRILTPDILATLRATSVGPGRKHASSGESATTSAAPTANRATLTARVSVTFRFRDRSTKDCHLRTSVPSRALDLRRVRLSCRGSGKAYVTLRTDASGRGRAVSAELDRDVVTLNGAGWRYNGLRSAGKDPNELRSAKITVTF